jgi:hypothetical protein
MKTFKKVLVLLLFASVTLTASAQGKSPFDQKKVANKQVEQLAAELGLNADQKKQVAALNVERENQQAAIRAELKASMTEESTKPSEAAKTKAQADRKTMRQAYRQGLKGILTPEQFEKWKELDKDVKSGK